MPEIARSSPVHYSPGRGSGTRTVKVAGTVGDNVTDSDWLAGQVLEDDTYTLSGGSIVKKIINGAHGCLWPERLGSAPESKPRKGSPSGAEIVPVQRSAPADAYSR